MDVKRFDPDAPLRRGIFALYFGEPGTGKTFNAASYPGPMLLLDTENRASIALSYRRTIGEDVDKAINIYAPRTMTDLRDAVEWFSSTKEFKDASKSVEPGNAPTLVIDSATALMGFAEDEYLRLNGVETIFPRFAWGQVYSIVDQFIVSCRALPMNVVLTAQMKDEFRGENRTGIRIPDMYKKLPFWVDIVISCGYEKEEQEGRFTTTVLKNGYGKNQRFALDPGFESLARKILPQFYDN